VAYTLLDLQTSIQDDLKDASFSTARITRYLNYAQRAIFNTHLFKFCEKAVSGALTVGVSTFEQQDDHQATIGGVIISPTVSTDYVILDEDNYLAHRDFFARFPNHASLTNGRPSSWTEFGDQVYFDRPVDLTYTFLQRYYRIPTALSSSGDVPDLPEVFRELLELYAVYRAEKYRGNHDVAATFKQEYEDGLEAMAMRYSPVTAVAATRLRQRRVRVYE
jgi:hypothetical protein